MAGNRSPRERLDSLIRSWDSGNLADELLNEMFCKLLVDADDQEASELVKDLPVGPRQQFVELIQRLEEQEYRCTWLSLEDPRTREQMQADEDRLQEVLLERAPGLLQALTAKSDPE